MTNKEAKEKLYMEWQKFLEDNIDYAGISEAYKTAFKALEQEPKTGHWIPVSMKLPKVEQYALITVHNQTKICWYQNGVFVDGEQNAYTKENEELVAWMPLPKPYKVEREEDKNE